MNYIICGDCEKRAHVISAKTPLPPGYTGELYPECQCWVADLEKLKQAEKAEADENDE